MPYGALCFVLLCVPSSSSRPCSYFRQGLHPWATPLVKPVARRSGPAMSYGRRLPARPFERDVTILAPRSALFLRGVFAQRWRTKRGEMVLGAPFRASFVLDPHGVPPPYIASHGGTPFLRSLVDRHADTHVHRHTHAVGPNNVPARHVLCPSALAVLDGPDADVDACMHVQLAEAYAPANARAGVGRPSKQFRRCLWPHGAFFSLHLKFHKWCVVSAVCAPGGGGV